jgi:cation diffusion facilitator family transporter
MADSATRRVVPVIAALTGNLVIAVAKLVAAFVTGSGAMLAEGIHSVADTANQALLLFGDWRSRQPSDRQHPFGYGRELYFWSLVVAVVLFGMGGGLSIHQGVQRLRIAVMPTDEAWNFAVLGVAFVAEGASLRVAWRHFREEAGPRSWWQSFRDSKDPRIFVPLAEDVAALLGVIVAVAGVYLTHRLHMPVFDAAASIGIGAILAGVAVLLAVETRSLLVGERADPALLRRVRDVVRREPGADLADLVTVHIGPEQISATLAVTMARGQTLGAALEVVERLKTRIAALDARLIRIVIELKAVQPTRSPARPRRRFHRRAADAR